MKRAAIVFSSVAIAILSAAPFAQATCPGGKPVFYCGEKSALDSSGLNLKFSPSDNLLIVKQGDKEIGRTQHCAGDLNFYTSSTPLSCSDAGATYQFTREASSAAIFGTIQYNTGLHQSQLLNCTKAIQCNK